MTTFQTQSTDMVGSTGLHFDTNDETWTIAANALIDGTADDGVSSIYYNSSLYNYGSIFSGLYIGAAFTHPGASVFNDASASIVGGDKGIYMDGNGASINNSGSVIGYGIVGILFDSNSDNIMLKNSGLTYGHDYGVDNESKNSGGSVFNAGLIRSDQYGIYVNTQSTLRACRLRRKVPHA